jgi:opacity protein-like surface antigen
MKAILLAAVAAFATVSAPVSARVLQFTITNVSNINNKGNFSFTIDEDRTPDVVLANQVSYGTTSPKLSIAYTNVPSQGAGTVQSALTLFTAVPQGGLAFTGPGSLGTVRLFNTTLISNSGFNTALPKDQNKAVFKLGTFQLSTTAQNSGPRPFDNYAVTIAAVPEPASWALMIAGFGLAGGALRIRRRPVADCVS